MIRLIFSLILISYVWWIYFLLLTKKEVKYPENNEAVSIVIPCYNENKKVLLRCVESIIRAKGEKEIILINNNSNKEETLKAFEIISVAYPNVKIIEEKRQGKRFAHEAGIKKASNNIIVFVDSDTIIDENALIEIKKPFFDEKVGGVAGKVLLYNKNDNLITKAINAMFWTSSSIFRQASGNIGFMQVSAGALSAYRKNVLLKLLPYYLNQKFLGRPVGISDDRFLTMRTQTLLGLKIVYQDSAVSYTIMPKTFIGFWKVLERWKRGVLREVLLFWKEPKSKAKLLFFDTEFNFIIMNIMLGFKIFLIISLLLHFSLLNLLFTIAWFLLMGVFYGGYMLVNNPKDFKYKLLYIIFYEFFWVFTYFNAWINVRNQGKWVTR